MRILLAFIILFVFISSTHAQTLKIKSRNNKALTGSEFAKLISDSTINLNDRENLIYDEIKKGNVPDFLRKLHKIEDELNFENKKYKITYYVLPDYLAIGNNTDYFYIPMTPILAQRVANLLKCSLPTKKIVDVIYQQATLKLTPFPIPPTKAMTTVPIFITHNDIVQQQLAPYLTQHTKSELTAGHKKDIILSNKIYTEKTAKVVIYGWHQLNGKAIQPVYNKHTNTWADYSHGIRLIQNKVFINGKKTTLKKVFADTELHFLISDEGVIQKAYYPITTYE